MFDKEFETWWITNKFILMHNENVGLKEIAHAGWEAGLITLVKSAKHSVGCTCPLIDDHTMGINPECVVHGELASR